MSLIRLKLADSKSGNFGCTMVFDQWTFLRPVDDRRAHSEVHILGGGRFHLENGRFYLVCGALEDTTIGGGYWIMDLDRLVIQGLDLV